MFTFDLQLFAHKKGVSSTAGRYNRKVSVYPVEA